MKITFDRQGLADAIAWAKANGYVVPSSKQPVNMSEKLKLFVLSDALCELHTESRIYVYTQF